MRVRSNILIAMVCGIISCKNDVSHIEPENALNIISTNTSDSFCFFEKYLFENFNLQISDSPHHYVLIPNYGCGLCLRSSIETIKFYAQNINYKINTFIIANKECINDSFFKTNIDCYFDEVDNMSKLNLPIANVTIVYTNKKTIDSIKPFEANENDLQKLFLKP